MLWYVCCVIGQKFSNMCEMRRIVLINSMFNWCLRKCIIFEKADYFIQFLQDFIAQTPNKFTFPESISVSIRHKIGDQITWSMIQAPPWTIDHHNLPPISVPVKQDYSFFHLILEIFAFLLVKTITSITSSNDRFASCRFQLELSRLQLLLAFRAKTSWCAVICQYNTVYATRAITQNAYIQV